MRCVVLGRPKVYLATGVAHRGGFSYSTIGSATPF